MLDRLLDAVRTGESRALVVSGEPGVGKSALLDYAMGSASGFRIARAAGIESEMELAFAGLHQLCAPLLDRLAHLPDPQQDALYRAFGLASGTTERFVVAGASSRMPLAARIMAPVHTDAILPDAWMRLI